MTAPAENSRELLSFIEEVIYGTAEATAASVTYRLQQTLPNFLALLQHKVMGTSDASAAPWWALVPWLSS